ncbi:putative receptor protein kinase ZmPK1 [Hordeum vulgare]|nr:putative receptor protein kinase ZmPK1 [Hordeum vulgare]
MTSAAGIVAPALAPAMMKPSNLPNAARPKKGKTSAKKNKATGASGTSKSSRKKLAGRVRGEAAAEAPASSLVEPAADAHSVFDDMPKDHEFEVDEDGEGIVGAPKGRGGNYTNEEDVVLCKTWLDVSRDPFVGGHKSREAYWLRMKEHFDLCNDDEKSKKRDDIDDLDLSKRRKKTIDLEDDEEEDASSEEGKRSPTPNSVSYSKPKQPVGTKKDAKQKKKRKGDDELKNAMEAIVNARKEANEVRKMARNQDAVAEERRLAAEERSVAAEERKVALEERKVAMEEQSKLLEWEKHLFFLDTSLFNGWL